MDNAVLRIIKIVCGFFLIKTHEIFRPFFTNSSEPRRSYRSSSVIPESSIIEHQIVDGLPSSSMETVPQQTNPP